MGHTTKIAPSSNGIAKKERGQATGLGQCLHFLQWLAGASPRGGGHVHPTLPKGVHETDADPSSLDGRCGLVGERVSHEAY